MALIRKKSGTGGGRFRRNDLAQGKGVGSLFFRIFEVLDPRESVDRIVYFHTSNTSVYLLLS